jgi:DNA repair photolyase
VLKVVKLLAERKIVSWLITRGKIDCCIAEQWSSYRDLIHISLPVVSHDKTIQTVFEPNTARLKERLDSYRRLSQQNIRTEVILEPMLPNLTDTREHLEELLEHFAIAGVTHVTAGYMVLRPETKETMAAALEPSGWSELVLSPYSDGVRIRKGPQAPALMLSKARRQRGYALLMALAANVGISVRLSSRSNPDFGSTTNR